MTHQHSALANKTRSGLDSGLDVLELLARERREMSLTEIARALGMSKSGVHSLLATLLRREFVQRTQRAGYLLGIGAWQVGNAAPGLDIGHIAAPHMMRLAEEISEGVILGRLEGTDVVYLQLVESPQAVRVHASVGDRIPAYCTSTGLALLSSLTNDELRARIPQRLKAMTPATLTSREAVLREVETTRRRGYAINRGGWRYDVGGISVCIRDAAGTILGAICVAVPRYRMTKAWLAAVLSPLEETAAQIGREASPPQALVKDLLRSPMKKRA